jgi:hypothetical protein
MSGITLGETGMKKKLFQACVCLFCVVLSFFVLSCNSEIADPDNLYSTPTAKGTIVLPENSELSYSDIYIQVAPTGVQYRVNEDGSWVVPDLTPIDGGYRLFFRNGPFSTTIRSIDKGNDSGNHYGALKDHVTGSVGHGTDVGVIPIKKTGSFSGNVSLKEMKDNESNMDITVFIPGTSFMAIPDEEGKYVLSGLPEGVYSIGFRANGYVTQTIEQLELNISSDDETIVLIGDVELVSAAGSIKGYVSIPGDYSTTDIEPNVSINMINQNRPDVNYVIPLQDGTFFKNGIEAGIYKIEVGLAGYMSVIKGDIAISEAALTEIAEPFTLVPNGGSIKGQVKLQFGTDYSGISVLAKCSEGVTYSTTTDREGSFVFEKCLPGKYEILFAKAEYGSASVDTSVTVGQDAPFIQYELRSSTGFISGKVSLSDGKTPNAIDVTAKHESGIIKTAITDSEGNYFFEKCMAGEYVLTFSKDGYSTSIVESVSVMDGESTKVDRMLMKNTGNIVGNLVFPDENVPISVSVIARHESGESFYAMPDENGSFSIVDCPAGLYEVEVKADGFFSQMQSIAVVEMQDSRMEFAMRRSTGIIRGSLTFGESEAVPSSVKISIVDTSDPANVSVVLADADGSFVLNGCKPGMYDLTMTADDYFTIEESVTVVAGETVVLDRNMQKSVGSLLGAISLSDSSSAEGVAITLAPLFEGEMRYAVTDGNGRYSVSRLVSGLYDITFSKSGYVTVKDQILIIAGNEHQMNLQLTRSLGSITGFVRLAGSPDYSGATVTAKRLGGDGKSYVGTTAYDGSFNITGISEEGLYQIIASKTGFESNSSMQADVKFSAIAVVDTIELRNISVTVTGKITLEGTGNYENVSVLLEPTDGSGAYPAANTNQEGIYAFRNVAPGEYTILAMKDGYVSKNSARFTVEKSKDFTVDDIGLVIGSRSVIGHVTLENTNDFSGILVTATDLSDPSSIHSAITNDSGDFSLVELKPGRYRITYSKENYGTYTISEVDIVADSVRTLDSVELSINRGNIIGLATLEGRVDHSGIKVTLVDTGDVVYTGSDGSYCFSVPSGNYPGGVQFEMTDFALNAAPETITVLTGSSYGVHNVELKATHITIIGIVDVKGTDDDGNVAVTIDGTDFKYVTSDDGEFIFEHVPLDRGRYVLSFDKDNAPLVTKEVTVSPATFVDAGIVSIMPNAATIYGHVTLDGMTDHENIEVTAVSNDSSAHTLRTRTDAGGAFRLGNVLTTGTYTVTFSKEGWDSRSINVSNLMPLEERNVSSDEEIIMKDSTSPILSSVRINNGANTASDKTVLIYIDASDGGSGLSKMQICFDGVFDRTVTMLDFKSVFSVTLPAGNGEKAVYAKVYDKSGNESAVVKSSVVLVDQKTEIGGRILEDTTLTSAESPYLVIGNIVIESGVTLTIEEGVDLQFADKYYITCFGNIHALGTAEHPVVFESVSDDVRWMGINSTSSVVLGGEAFAPTFEYGSYLKNVIVRDNSDGICGDVFIEDSTIDSEYALGSENRKFSGTVIDSSLVGDVMLSGNFRLVGNMISAPRFSIFSNDSKMQDSSVIFGNDISGDSLELFLFNGYYHDIAVVNNYFREFRLDEYSSMLHSGTVISENNTFENMDAILFNNKDRRVGSNNYIDSTLNIIIEEQDTDQNVLKYGDNFSNIIDCGPLDAKTGISARRIVDYQYNFWGYDKTEILDNSGTMTPDFIIDQTDDMDKSIIEYSNWVHDAYPYAGYRGEDYVGFEMELQENNNPLFRINEKYEMESTGEAIEFNISSLTDERLSDYRVSFDAEYFTNSSDDGWKTIPSDGNISIKLSPEDVGAELGDDLFIQVRDFRGKLSAVRIVPANTNVSGPAGGLICYDKGNNADGWRYIEATPSNIRYDAENGRYTCDSTDPGYYSFQRYFEYGFANRISEGEYSFPVFSNGTVKYDKETCTILDIGAGKRNTEILMTGIIDSNISFDYPAARACYELEYNGYDDWYLPSRNEAYLFADILPIDVNDSVYEIMSSSESSANSEKFHRVELRYGFDGKVTDSVSSSVDRSENHDVWGIRYF